MAISPQNSFIRQQSASDENASHEPQLLEAVPDTTPGDSREVTAPAAVTREATLASSRPVWGHGGLHEQITRNGSARQQSRSERTPSPNPSTQNASPKPHPPITEPDTAAKHHRKTAPALTLTLPAALASTRQIWGPGGLHQQISQSLAAQQRGGSNRNGAETPQPLSNQARGG
ncbi:hypothetical protein PRK78_006811 [Emydomyces testavorans]|uniref:Uncharacterized protein n=1 Tax=Emydomyces testavorans TaxID=2070801 RepID=A0AAF0DM33_9EURO|nr:hypothetical protein PRK78_006811 [Emydomyces testavorans]